MKNDNPAILVVDDEVDTCRNLADIFTDLGYRVDIAHDGPSALKLVRENTYDVALLDMKMPGMDGLTLYREIKKLSSGTVAIIVTAFASTATTSEALAAGAIEVLPKPVDFPRLLGRMGQALDQPLALVVDDDEDLCDNLWDLFHEKGYRVCVAHDENQAEARLKARNYDVVLIDMKLPQGDGSGVFHKVKEANPRARTIAISGCGSETEHLVEKVVAEGADAVCYKPFDVNALLSTLERLSGRKSPG